MAKPYSLENSQMTPTVKNPPANAEACSPGVEDYWSKKIIQLLQANPALKDPGPRGLATAIHGVAGQEKLSDWCLYLCLFSLKF